MQFSVSLRKQNPGVEMRIDCAELVEMCVCLAAVADQATCKAILNP
jgi:hypothetical protein